MGKRLELSEEGGRPVSNGNDTDNTGRLSPAASSSILRNSPAVVLYACVVCWDQCLSKSNIAQWHCSIGSYDVALARNRARRNLATNSGPKVRSAPRYSRPRLRSCGVPFKVPAK